MPNSTDREGWWVRKITLKPAPMRVTLTTNASRLELCYPQKIEEQDPSSKRVAESARFHTRDQNSLSKKEIRTEKGTREIRMTDGFVVRLF